MHYSTHTSMLFPQLCAVCTVCGTSLWSVQCCIEVEFETQMRLGGAVDHYTPPIVAASLSATSSSASASASWSISQRGAKQQIFVVTCHLVLGSTTFYFCPSLHLSNLNQSSISQITRVQFCFAFSPRVSVVVSLVKHPVRPVDQTWLSGRGGVGRKGGYKIAYYHQTSSSLPLTILPAPTFRSSSLGSKRPAVSGRHNRLSLPV